MKPKTRYHWRVAPGRLANQPEGWSQCSLGTWSFTTAERAATIKTLDQEGDTYVTDFLGLVEVEVPEGANSLGLQFSVDEPPDCEDAYDYVTTSDRERYFLFGNAFDPIASFQAPNGRMHHAPYEEGPPSPAQYYQAAGIPLSAIGGMTAVFGTLEPGTIGYLTVTPMRGQERGQCSTFELRTTELGHFAKIGRDPGSDDWYYPHFVVLDHETGKPQNGLQFTRAAGAVEYEARISSLKGISAPPDPAADPTSIALMKADRRSPDCGLHLDDQIYTWTFDGCGNDDFLKLFGRGIPAESNQYRHFGWELWARGEKGQMRLSATRGMDFAGGLPFTFVWDGVAWHPRGQVEPHVFFQGAEDPIWLFSARALSPPLYGNLRRLFIDISDERFPAPQDWVSVNLATTETSVKPHEVKLCVPRQLPFMDRIAVEMLTVRWLGQGTEEVVYRDRLSFESAQGRDGKDCHPFIMDTSNPPDDQVAIIVRGLAPGHSAVPQGFFIADMFGEMDEDEDALGGDGDSDDDEDEEDDDDEDCLELVRPPEPALNQPYSRCTSTGQVLDTVSIGGTQISLVGATCPETAPAVVDLSFGVKPDPTVAGHFIGICGNPGSCTVRAVRGGEQAVGDFTPKSLGISSDNNRYTFTIYAHDGCGRVSEPLAAQLDYIGDGCNVGPRGSACGSICEKCCNSGCDYLCSHDNCESCSGDNPYDSNWSDCQ